MKCNENNLLYFLYNDYHTIHEIHKKSFPGVKSKIQIHENLFLQNLKILNQQNQTQISCPTVVPTIHQFWSQLMRGTMRVT